MTETDVESIWDTTWDTTRFGKIGIRIAELLNIIFNNDATTNVTDTKVLPYLEQFSEELLLDLNLAAKANKFADTWGFIQANVSDFFIRKVNRNRWFIDMILKILNKTESIEITSLSGLGASNDI